MHTSAQTGPPTVGAPSTAWTGRSWWALAAFTGVFVAPIALIRAFHSRLYVVLDTPAYLVFHNVTELFSVVTSLAIFAVAWFTHNQTRDRHGLFLGCVFLAVGLVDLMHTLGYAGMPALVTANSANKSTQFWIAARVFSAGAFLASAFVDPSSRAPWLSRRVLLPLALAFPAVVFTLVTFFPDTLPATFVAGEGLTRFKRGAEYVSVALFALAAAACWRRASRPGGSPLAAYALAFTLGGLSELLFAGYRSVFDTYNVVGHVYKVLAFAVVFRAGFVASVKRPYAEVLAKEAALRREVAERKRTEVKFVAFAEAADLVFWITRRDPEAVLYVNPAFERIWGRSTAEAYQDPRAWIAAIHPADRQTVADAFATWLRGPADTPYDVQYRIVRPDGETRWIADRGFALEREGGAVQLIAGIATDVSDRLRTEDQLRQSQKLEAVGRLAGGVAHDFNNLLTVILGGCDVLLSGSDAGGAVAEELKEIDAAARRAAALTRQLLAFSRRQVIQPKVLDLDEIVGGMSQLLRRLIGEDVELVTVLGATRSHVRADPAQLEQVIVNLAVNARDAMPQGGLITLETSRVVLEPGSGGFWNGVALPGGSYVALAIGDTGCGMTDAVFAHLFEPFFTTKPVGRGTGLGLSTVYGIVMQAGGGVRVRSSPGAGSRFEVFLPSVNEVAGPVAEPVAAPGAEPVAASAPRGTETILVVEDDAAVRRLAVRALRDAGFWVIGAANGLEALQLAAGRNIDLLVTDVVMPVLGGPELADRLLRDRPALRVLFVTGYSDRRLGPTFDDRRTALQPKPFTPDVLLRRVRELLDRRLASGVELAAQRSPRPHEAMGGPHHG